MLAFALMCGQAFSQVETERKAGFQFGLFPPLSTNGLHSYRYTNDVSLNLLVGLSKNENVLTVGGLANVVTNEANGFQLAGLVNIAGKESRGVQFAGLANTSKHHAGFQSRETDENHRRFLYAAAPRRHFARPQRGWEEG